MLNAVIIAENRNQLVGRYASNNTLSTARNDFVHGEIIDAVRGWTVAEVVQWLQSKGFGEFADRFEKHQITGEVLLTMDMKQLFEIGVKRMRSRIDITMEIKRMTRHSVKPNAAKLKVPSWRSAMWQFFSFAWAQTSEGKTASQKKEEIVIANTAISLVAAVMTNVCYNWFTATTNTCFCTSEVPAKCFCSAGFDLADEALWAFHAIVGVAGILFLGATVFAVLQIVSVNEMSDEDEIEIFLDLVDKFETVPGQLTSGGLLLTAIAIVDYILFNERLGLKYHPNNVLAWFTMLCFVGLFVYVFGYASATMVRNVYKAKIQTSSNVEENTADLFKKQHSPGGGPFGAKKKS